MSAMHFYEPAAGHGLAHDPFNSIIGPRPIGWVSTRGADGAVNLAPYSFFNAFNYTPPIIGFASTGPKNSRAQCAGDGRIRVEPGNPQAGRADERHLGFRALRRG